MASDESYYIVRYQADAVQEATSTNQGIDEDGIEAAFDVSHFCVLCVIIVIVVILVTICNSV